MPNALTKRSFPFLVLFTSASTLVCCALPALFVTLGLGATFASLISAVPQLVWLSEHKPTLFIFSAIMLAIGGIMQWRAKDAPCPIEPELRRSCLRARRFSLGFYLLSVLIYLIGFSFAYLLPLFL
jgi:hypothetical protein